MLFGTHIVSGVWVVNSDGQEKRVRGRFVTTRGLANELDYAYIESVLFLIHKGVIGTIQAKTGEHLIPILTAEAVVEYYRANGRNRTWRKTFPVRFRRSPGGRSAGDGAEPTAG